MCHRMTEIRKIRLKQPCPNFINRKSKSGQYKSCTLTAYSQQYNSNNVYLYWQKDRIKFSEKAKTFARSHNLTNYLQAVESRSLCSQKNNEECGANMSRNYLTLYFIFT